MPDRQPPSQMTSADVAEGPGKQDIGINREAAVAFTQESLQEFLGPRFFVKPSRQGNFQINIANMRASSDDDKVTLLYRAREMLRSKGFTASIKLTFRSQVTSRFENWPCIWVDEGESAQLSQLGRLKQLTQTLLAKLTTMGVSVDPDIIAEAGGGDQFEEDREIQPTDEDMEHQAAVMKNKQNVSEGKGLRSLQDPFTREPQLNQPSPGYPGDERQHRGTPADPSRTTQPDNGTQGTDEPTPPKGRRGGGMP